MLWRMVCLKQRRHLIFSLNVNGVKERNQFSDITMWKAWRDYYDIYWRETEELWSNYDIWQWRSIIVTVALSDGIEGGSTNSGIVNYWFFCEEIDYLLIVVILIIVTDILGNRGIDIEERPYYYYYHTLLWYYEYCVPYWYLMMNWRYDCWKTIVFLWNEGNCWWYSDDYC